MNLRTECQSKTFLGHFLSPVPFFSVGVDRQVANSSGRGVVKVCRTRRVTRDRRPADPLRQSTPKRVSPCSSGDSLPSVVRDGDDFFLINAFQRYKYSPV